jgi:signal transduction histidine kinase
VSIRLRLTLLYSIILVLALVAFSATTYVIVSRVLLDFQKSALAEEATQILAQGVFTLTVVDTPRGRIAVPQTFVQVRTFDGEVAGKSPNLGGFTLPLSEEGLERLRSGDARSWTEAIATSDGRLLVYSKPFRFSGQSAGILQVARSLTDQDRALGALKWTLVVGTGLATVVAFGIGWGLAGLSLRPINRITQTAQEIGAQRDFGRRVAHTGPNDEIGSLVTTFNTMLTELQAAYKQVEQALQAQRRFVADASHELRTPLTTIRGNVALLRRDPPISEEDRVAVLTDVAEEIERMIRLVNGLLLLARTDAGLPLRTEPVSLRPLVEDVCRQALVLAAGRDLVFDEQVDALVLADRDALKQVLLNLLDNALKYSPDGGTVTVTSAERDGRVEISVRDTGPGIDPAILPHVFERFYRGDTARSGHHAGLGLAIAKSLVEAQHGSISVRSQLGHGSVFTVVLPCAEDAPEDVEVPRAATATPPLGVTHVPS